MDVGFGELLLILALALIILGPQKLPEVGAAIGRALYELRRATADVSATLLGGAPAAPTPPPAPPTAGQPCAVCGAFMPAERRFCGTCGADQEAGLLADAPRPASSPDGPLWEDATIERDQASSTAGERSEPELSLDRLSHGPPPEESAVPFSPKPWTGGDEPPAPNSTTVAAESDAREPRPPSSRQVSDDAG